MVSRTNVNDAAFPHDWILNNDYLRDSNANEEAIRDTMLDLFGTRAVIFSGLTIQNGTNPDTFMITTGRARDLNKFHVVVPAGGIDNIPALNTAGGWNYIAISHAWSYAGARAAVKNAAAYNSVRADSYLQDVNPVIRNEAAGYILLGRAQKIAGVWYYEMWEPYRSIQATLNSFEIDFTYLGCPGGAAVWGNRHDLVGLDLFPVSTALVITRGTVMARVVGTGNTDIELFANGANALGVGIAFVTLATGTLGPTTAYWPYGALYARGDRIQTNIVPPIGPLVAATDISVTFAGYRVGGV